MKDNKITMRTTRILTLIAAAITVAAAGCGQHGDPAAAHKGKPGVGDPGGAIPVQVADVHRETIQASIPVTGSLVALQDVQLSAKATGRVANVYVHVGDSVKAGQLLIQQDTADLIDNVRQAQANVLTAQSKVSQAIDNYQIQLISAKQDVANSRARLSGAQQNYLKMKRGLRPQEVLQSENSLISAKANRDNALTTLTRNKSLFAQGAIAKADVDQAQTSYDVFAAQYKNAQEAVSLAQQGNRAEDIASARDQVRQQQTALETSIANQRQIGVRKSDIDAARAGVAQAQATLAFNQQQLDNASIHSPINGIVAARTTEPGQIASPGTNLLRVVNLKSIYYQPTISETDLDEVSVGTPVDVTIDAVPGHVFPGHVTALYPAASATDRNYSLRVGISNADNLLRPGMFARGGIVTKVRRDVAVVPATALVPDSSQQGFAPNASSDATVSSGLQNAPQHVVVVGSNNQASLRPVKIGIANMDKVEITSGVNAGERIVVVGQQTLKTGDKVAIVNATASASPGGHRGAAAQ